MRTSFNPADINRFGSYYPQINPTHKVGMKISFAGGTSNNGFLVVVVGVLLVVFVLDLVALVLPKEKQDHGKKRIRGFSSFFHSSF